MAAKTTILYYNTGFDPENIPDSPSLLNSCEKTTLAVHFDLQDLFLTTIDLNIQWDNVKDADYLKFGDAYYFILGIKMINVNNARLYLQLDALTTMGGPSALSYNGGIVEQCHQQDDTLGNNIIDPAIGCSEILQAFSTSATTPVSGIQIVASTLDLSAVNSMSTAGIGEATAFQTDIGTTGNPDIYTVVVPKSLPPAQPTQLGSGSGYYTAGFGYYLYNDARVQSNIQYLRELGIEGALLYSYTIPSAHYTAGSNGHIDTIETFAPMTSINASLPNYNAYNNKTKITYAKIVAQNVVSGDSHTFEPMDVLNPNTGTFDFTISGDFQYGGRMYMKPIYYKGSGSISISTLPLAVKSLPWKEYPIAFNTMSGSQWAANQYAIDRGEVQRFYANPQKAATRGGEGILSNVYGAAREIMKMEQLDAISFYNNIGGEKPKYLTLGAWEKANPAAGNLDPKMFDYAKADAAYGQKQVIAPDLSCSPAFGLQNIITDQFTVWVLRPTLNDLDKIDLYYTQYGYPQGGKIFNKSMLSHRSKFNYIKMSSVEITRGSGFGLAIRREAERQLVAGVRIWHVLPTPVTVGSNPIV